MKTKRVSKYSEKFGTGLSLGVPGDSNTAVLMGAFVMQGFQPGPMMYVEHLVIVQEVFASMISAVRNQHTINLKEEANKAAETEQ